MAMNMVWLLSGGAHGAPMSAMCPAPTGRATGLRRNAAARREAAVRDREAVLQNGR